MLMNRPHVTLIMAITADGKIAKSSSHLTNWTSKEDKAFFMSETKKAGVVIMGKNTYNTFKRPLPNRLNIVLTREEQVSIPGQLEFKNASPKEILDELGQRGYERVALIGGASINGAFLEAGLIDEILLTIEPRLFGKGLDIFSDIDCDIALSLISIKQLNKDVLCLHYKLIY